MTIYQPQISTVLSVTHRGTGAALSGRMYRQFTSVQLTHGIFSVLYAFSIAYLVAPGTFDSTHVIDFVAGLPDVVKYGAKTLLAFPFAYHSYNGIRHLVWDVGKCWCPSSMRAYLYIHPTPVLTVKGMYSTGYAVIGATAVSTIALVLM